MDGFGAYLLQLFDEYFYISQRVFLPYEERTGDGVYGTGGATGYSYRGWVFSGF